MPIRSSLSFSYAGISSATKGLTNVNTSSGMLEEPFFAEKAIHEIKIKGNPKPYFQQTELSPLQFNVSFSFDEAFDSTKLRDIASWLCNQSYYQPLYFSDNPNKVYFALVVESPTLIHNSLEQGYINLTFRCNSPYSYSTENTGTSKTLFTNNGDLIVRPELWITKTVGDGDVSIINQTNSNLTLTFTGLTLNEEVYIDNENEYIESSLEGIYRYDNHNGNFLEMLTGNNTLSVNGDCTLSWRWRNIFLQG